MIEQLKRIFIGKPKNPHDQQIFHKMSLIAFFAWIGIGADGLSSSCYGPEAAFLALGEHKYLSIFVALLSALTVFLISASYSQIIELFPNGGGGYLVASRLINPTVGMVSGCALVIDYVLTIAISVASGADALFSSLGPDYLPYKIPFEFVGISLLMILNMRGVKESVIPLTPIFMTFIVTHLFAIVFTLVVHSHQIPHVFASSANEIGSLNANIGFLGIVFLILRSFSLGAGTFTGIEAVSNGLVILRDPKVVTGKKTMLYMAVSLAFTVVGLMIGYLLLDITKSPDKTLNASFFETLASSWHAPWGHLFVVITLLSETLLLFVAAQAGFIDGPRVLANLALDKWAPARFAHFSDRLVTQNGIILMGISSLVILSLTRGSVETLVILYSINVFITFCLSQSGMVVHWWKSRKTQQNWQKKILINGFGLMLTGFILISMVILKFHEGGWVTLAMTAALAACAWGVRRHYLQTYQKLSSLASIENIKNFDLPRGSGSIEIPSTEGKTAIFLVNGYNGLGLHTLLNAMRFFKNDLKNFIFIEIGVIDAGNFKDSQEFTQLKTRVENDLKRYETLMRGYGYYAKGYYSLGTDVTQEIEELTLRLAKDYKNCLVFGGQLVFAKESLVNRLLHNYTVFSVHKRLYYNGIPMMVLPVRI